MSPTRERNGTNIDHPEPSAEGLDVLAQRVLHVAQLAPDVDHFGAELLDRVALLGGENDAALLVGLDVADLLLDIAQLGFELLLLGPEFELGLATDAVDELEGADRKPAAAKTDNGAVASEIIERIEHEARVAGDRHRQPLAEKILRPDPGLVG